MRGSIQLTNLFLQTSLYVQCVGEIDFHIDDDCLRVKLIVKWLQVQSAEG